MGATSVGKELSGGASTTLEGASSCSGTGSKGKGCNSLADETRLREDDRRVAMGLGFAEFPGRGKLPDRFQMLKLRWARWAAQPEPPLPFGGRAPSGLPPRTFH